VLGRYLFGCFIYTCSFFFSFLPVCFFLFLLCIVIIWVIFANMTAMIMRWPDWLGWKRTVCMKICWRLLSAWLESLVCKAELLSLMWRTLKICWQWNSDFQAGGFLTFYPERNIGSNLEPASVAGSVKIKYSCFVYSFFFVRWSRRSKAEAWKWIWIWVWHPSWVTTGSSAARIRIQWQAWQEVSLRGWLSDLRSSLDSGFFSFGC